MTAGSGARPSVDDRSRWFANHRDRAWLAPPPDRDAIAFHRELTTYELTPLTELPDLATELGVDRVVAKEESRRLGLPAFKALGASWAIRRAIDEYGGAGPVTIVSATEGNHGRAVARFARIMGQRATILIPRGVQRRSIEAIRAEGADVVDVDGSYNDAVARAARMGQAEGCLLVQDTAWEEYEEIPRWIVDGYDTLFVELDHQLAARRVERPSLVVVPTGVGSLLQAALIHYRGSPADQSTAVVSVEPDDAACVHASLSAGRRTTVPTGATTMAGLNCGTVSTSAWPAIAAGLDAALVTDDVSSMRAAATLARLGVDAGPCGAAPLAGLRDVLSGPHADLFRHHVGLTRGATIVLLITEGSAANPTGVTT